MNQDLRHSLLTLLDVGENHATPTDAATRRALGLVGSARRRRPVLVAGLTTVSLLSAGAAAAVGYSHLAGDDGVAFPDRITSGFESSATPGGAPSDPAPGGAEGPAATDPTALTFPQCGAHVATTGADTLQLVSWTDQPEDLPADRSGDLRLALAVSAQNVGKDHLVGTATGLPRLALVQDGVVVGAAHPDVPDTATAPFELAPQALFSRDATVKLTACDASGTAQPTDQAGRWLGPALPAGEYEIWGTQLLTVTERTTVAPDGSRGAPTPVDENHEVLTKVMDLTLD